MFEIFQIQIYFSWDCNNHLPIMSYLKKKKKNVLEIQPRCETVTSAKV